MLLAWLNVCSGPSIHSDSLKVVVMHRMMFFFPHCTKCSYFLEVWVQFCCITIIWKLFRPMSSCQIWTNIKNLFAFVCVASKGKKKKLCQKSHDSFFVQSWPLPAFKLVHILSLTHSLLFGCSFDPVNILQNSHRLLKGLIKRQRRQNIKICSRAPPYENTMNTVMVKEGHRDARKTQIYKSHADTPDIKQLYT